MARWKLKPNCLFVYAYDLETGQRLPQLPKAKIIHKPDPADNDPMHHTCLELNDGAAFVARFITMGVDTDLIEQILFSEYKGSGFTEEDAQTWVKHVCNHLQPFLIPCLHRTHQTPDVSLTPGGATSFPLDFKVNWLGGGLIKTPT